MSIFVSYSIISFVHDSWSLESCPYWLDIFEGWQILWIISLTANLCLLSCPPPPNLLTSLFKMRSACVMQVNVVFLYMFYMHHFLPSCWEYKKVTGAAVNKYILFLDRCHAKNCNSSQSLKILSETWIALVFEIGTGRVQKLGMCICERVSCWWRCRLYYTQSPSCWQTCHLHLPSRSHMIWIIQELVETELQPSGMKEMDNFSMNKSW